MQHASIIHVLIHLIVFFIVYILLYRKQFFFISIIIKIKPTVDKILLAMAYMGRTRIRSFIDDKEGIIIYTIKQKKEKGIAILVTKFSPDNMNIPHIVNLIDMK